MSLLDISNPKANATSLALALSEKDQAVPDTPKILGSVPIRFLNGGLVKRKDGTASLFQVQYVTKDSLFESIQHEGFPNLPNEVQLGQAVSTFEHQVLPPSKPEQPKEVAFTSLKDTLLKLKVQNTRPKGLWINFNQIVG